MVFERFLPINVSYHYILTFLVTSYQNESLFILFYEPDDASSLSNIQLASQFYFTEDHFNTCDPIIYFPTILDISHLQTIFVLNFTT